MKKRRIILVLLGVILIVTFYLLNLFRFFDSHFHYRTEYERDSLGRVIKITTRDEYFRVKYLGERPPYINIEYLDSTTKISKLYLQDENYKLTNSSNFGENGFSVVNFEYNELGQLKHYEISNVKGRYLKDHEGIISRNYDYDSIGVLTQVTLNMANDTLVKTFELDSLTNTDFSQIARPVSEYAEFLYVCDRYNLRDLIDLNIGTKQK